MTSPHVNVIIANHNYSEWLIGSLDSALNQDYPNISITVVDDGSTDDSWYQLYKHIFQFRPHEKILPSNFDIRTTKVRANKRDVQVNGVRLDKCSGPSFARNIAIELSLPFADYFAVLDADDEYYVTKVTKLVQAASTPPGLIGIAYSDYMLHNIETGVEQIEYKESFSLNRLQRECIIHSGALISKEALLFARDEFGFYDVNMRTCEDWDLWLRICKKYTAIHVPECLSLVRVTPKNSTNSVSKDVWQQNWNRIASKHVRQ